MLAAGAVVNHYVFSQTDPHLHLEGWKISWTIFAAYSLVVAVLFAVVFKYKHKPDEVK